MLLLVLLLLLRNDPFYGKETCQSNMFPSSGTWISHPPYYTPSGCNVSTINKSILSKCLKGRRVYSVGSSIARQYLFSTAELLGATSVNRTDQKERCKHNDVTWNNCVDSIGDINFHFMYQQYLDGFDYSTRGGFKWILKNSTEDTQHRRRLVASRGVPGTPDRPNGEELKYIRKWAPETISTSVGFSMPLNPKHNDWHFRSFKLIGEDYMTCDLGKGFVCSPAQLQPWKKPVEAMYREAAHDYLKPFFANATSNDVLILTVGLMYAMNMVTDSKVDFWSWITESAINFQKAVHEYFPGRVYRATLAPTNFHPVCHYNHYLYKTEQLLTRVFLEGEKDIDASKKWFTIDQWAINGKRFGLYNDPVHFHGPLTWATLNNLYTDFCGLHA